jgi:hypothetical protein
MGCPISTIRNLGPEKMLKTWEYNRLGYHGDIMMMGIYWNGMIYIYNRYESI